MAELFTVIIFVGVITVFFVLLIVLPKHVGQLSGKERTVLADYPVTASDISDGTFARELVRGTFSSNVDDFLESHFPGRQFFIALNSYASRLSGQNAVKSVTWGKNGRLYTEPAILDEVQTSKNLDRMLEFADANGLELTIVAVPSAGSVVPEELPLVHGDYVDASIYSYICEKTGGGASVPDIGAYLCAQSQREKLYYRTDHHWTMSGAYACYVRVCGALGEQPVDSDEFDVSEYEFFGTSYSTSGLFLTAPDTLEIWNHPDYAGMTVTVGDGSTAAVYDSLFDMSKLEPDCYDRYAAYLYGNNGITIIENPNGNGKTVMVLKDSFGNSFCTLLALNYSRVIMIDTRYYGTNPHLPSMLAEEYGVTQLLVIYGMDTITEKCDIAFLR